MVFQGFVMVFQGFVMVFQGFVMVFQGCSVFKCLFLRQIPEQQEGLFYQLQLTQKVNFNIVGNRKSQQESATQKEEVSKNWSRLGTNHPNLFSLFHQSQKPIHIQPNYPLPKCYQHFIRAQAVSVLWFRPFRPPNMLTKYLNTFLHNNHIHYTALISR